MAVRRLPGRCRLRNQRPPSNLVVASPQETLLECSWKYRYEWTLYEMPRIDDMWFKYPQYDH